MNSRPSPSPADPEGSAKTPATAASSSLLRLADAVDRAVSAVCQFVVLVSGCALFVLLAGNVVARYAFGGGFPFAQELPERIFPWFIMAGVALAVQRGGHMAVEALPHMLGRRGAQGVRLLGYAIVVAAYCVLGVVAFGVAEIVWLDRSPVLGLPASFSYYAMIGGCVAVILTTLAIAARVLLIGPEAIPQPAPEEMGT